MIRVDSASRNPKLPPLIAVAEVDRGVLSWIAEDVASKNVLRD